MTRNRFGKVMIIASLLAAFATVFSALSVFSQFRVYAAGNPGSISSAADLIQFAHDFNSGAYDDDCVVNVAMTNGTFIDLSASNFEGIGNADHPFRGKVVFADGALDVIAAGRAIFGCITPAAEIVDHTGSPLTIIVKRSAADSVSPLFADKVVIDPSDANAVADWRIVLENDDVTDPGEDNIFARPFSGVVSEIEAGCKVSVTFSHNSIREIGAEVTGTADCGTICGKLGEGAELTVDLTASVEYNVTSSSGNAGGIVGKMEDGSRLTLAGDFTSHGNVTSGSQYAGSLVGSAVNAVIDLDGNTVTMSKTVTGAKGSGGVFGYYKYNGSDPTRTFDLTGYNSDSGFVLSSAKISGGFIGKLESEKNIVVTDTESAGTYGKKVRFSGSSDSRGGVIGEYSNTSLANTLDIHNVEVMISADEGNKAGGAVGRFVGSEPVYVKIKDFTCNVSDGKIAAGLVADMGDAKLANYAGYKGSFVDLYDSTPGTVTVIGSCKSGLVHNMQKGVLRIHGTTDLSAAVNDTAQLVGTRGDGLVYALGSGNDAGWTFKRGTSAYDDIGDWGEVVRTANESELFTVNGSAHTVTVKPHVASMDSASDVVRTALNMQLNGGEDVGALCFENKTGSKKETLLGSTLSLASGSTDINLAGTGIVSFTRDDGSGDPFSGTFNGNGRTIRLAIGENYGHGVSAAGTKGNNNMGTIYRHRYPGLFAKINGGTVNDLTLDGFISVKPSSGDYYIGGIAGAATGPFTLNNVTTQQTGDNYQVGGSTSFGGAVGSIINYETATGTVNITNCEFNSKLNDKNGEGAVYGGVIGSVKTTNLLTINVSSTKLGGTFENSSAHGVKYGGLIGQISENNQNNNHIFNRTVNITDVTVTDSAVIKSKVSDGKDAGAFLGWEWLDTQVTIGTGGTNGLTIGGSGTGDGPKLEVTNGGANIGALVCNATGYWQVNNVKVNKAIVSAPGSSSKFGFMVYDATRSDSALYLELKRLSGQGKAYDLSGLDCTSASFSVYDEIVANTRNDNGGTNNNPIESNNNAVVSIKTTGSGVIMDGTNCNTYQNQKDYTPKVNPNARYYYNLDTIRENNNNSDGSPGEKLLLWSLNTYAHSSLKSKNYFNGGFVNNTFSGNMDMEGLSYYPVNYNGNVTISAGSTIKFYNKQIEEGESGTGNSDSTARSTRSVTKSQHYLMHEGMFLNYTGNLTVNGLTVAGNISNSGGSDGESGFIVRRKFGDASVTSEANLKNIVLAGAEIDRAGSYAPLLINTVGQNVKLSFDGVSAKTSGDGDKYDPTDTLTVASSLVGDVGYSTATNINLSFSRMKLDSRTEANSYGLNEAYGTHRSLFDHATFLESFRFLSGGIGVYNYEYAEDWGSGTPHGVTYAKEISESVEFSNRQINYYDHYQDTTAGYYTHPDGDGNAPYDFSSDFLPHVCTGYSETNKYHEIMVNIKQEDLTSGCGQYNDPYEITDGGMLVTAAKIIYGNPDNNIEICLPTDLGKSSLDMWCENCITHAIYKYTDTDGYFKNTTDSSDTKTLAQVREYLAGAYYLIKNSVEIPAGESFVGFGAVNDGSDTDFENKYAFRGVIVGGENIHITNNSANPLVKTANGCVLKDIYIDVEGSIVISLDTNSLKFRYDNGGSKFYGGAIGQVMGGDNIIDHVQIRFDDATITADNTGYTKLVPIGGYVGVVVNGGVIFRNMSGDGDIDGLPATVWEHVAESDTAWLYSNPIIGRVLSGYAFTESSSYVYDYTAVTMKNGRNNYSIPDLNSGTGNKISVKASSNSTHEITIPDGQSLYLLGCIVNSGAGSATYNKSSEQAYNAITGTPWSAYRKYTSTRCAKYSSVGKIVAANGNGTDDYVIVKDMDKYSSAVKVPYIIYKYTDKDGSVYRARSICNGNAPAVSQINFASGNFYLPASFRGLGSLYWDSPYLRLQFKRLDGKNAKLIYSTYFLDYDMQDTKGINLSNYNDANSNRKEHDNYINMHHVGLGLFSQFYQVQPGSDDYIKDFSVSGKIFYDIVKYSDGSPIAYNWTQNKDSQDSENSIYYYSVLNVGGVIGSVYGAKNQDDANNVTNTSTGSRKNQKESQFKIKNVTIDGAEFEGAKSVGGLIGYVGHSREENKNGLINREIVECGSTGVKLIAGVNAGGLIGYLNRNVTITGAEGKTDLYIDSIRIKGVNTTGGNSGKPYFDYISGDKIFCAGGLVGFADMKYSEELNNLNSPPSYKYPSVKAPVFSNYRIIGVGNKAHIYSENTNANNHLYVGGVVGDLKSASLKIQNVEISGLNLKATYAGGVVAAVFFDKNALTNLTLTLDNVTVDGGSGRSYIEGLRTAGGLIGRNESTNGSGVSTNSIESCVVKAYDIKSSATSCTAIKTYDNNTWYLQAVGAVAGISATPASDGITFNIHDLKVESCALTAKWSASNNATVGAGGLFGIINRTFVKGSDILLDGTTVNYHKNGAAAATNDDPRVAGLIGNNRDGGSANSYVKLVAVSIQDCSEGLTRLVGNNGRTGEVNFGTGGYVMLADLRGAAAGSSPNTAFATPVSAGSEIANPARSPYVHVNPIFDIGTSDLKLTGDGIAPEVLSLPLHTLMNGDWRYKYALSGSNKDDFNTYIGSKLSTFNTEQGTDIANDFAVLVVDDLSRNNVTDMINAYINLVANDNRELSATHLGGYADNVENVYTVQIYKYEWNGSKFVKKTGEANLKRKDNQFFMVSGDIDTSETKTFSLIDVQYCDPVSTGKIAYHLYIPVIVRKLLVFDFEIATGSGTNYQRSWYDDRFGKALMENMGTPVSIFFKYNYLRSKSDWEDAINAGDNLLGNFEKKLDFNTSAKLDADTVLVLVDPNDGGKPYYARYGDVFGNGTNGTFSLSSFKENLDGTGASFKSVSLCDLLDLRYVTDPSGLFVEDVQANATVKAKNSSGSVEAYFRLKTEIDTGPYYSISVNKTDESYTYDQNKSSYIVKLDESYYISFFTSKDDVSEKLHRYVFSSPSSIKDPDNPTPTRKVHNSYRERTDNAYLFMGSIFVQSDFAVKELTVNPLMAVDSHPADLDVYMRSTISIASDIYSGIRAYLSAMTDGEYNIKVYQSFILNLTRHESDSVMHKVFIDSADPSANVRINYASPGHDTGSASDYSVPCTVYPNGSYAEIRYDQPLNPYLIADELACTPAVVETRINVEYDSDDKLREQFPIRNDVEDNTKGTTVSGSSNVAYDPARTAYSKSTISGSDPIGKKYYCLLDEKKARLEYNVDIDFYDGDYDPLGINPLDYHDKQLAFSISTRAVYNLDEIYDKTVDYDMIRCTVKLYCKNDPTPYSVALSFPDYMETGSGVYLNNVAGATKSMNPADNYTTLVFTAPRSSILDISRDSTGRALEIPITYTIYTGKSETAGAVTFESQDHVYSNYKIYLEVELYKSSTPTDVLTSSKANDYLIYTNARIIPDFIDELS